MFEEFLIEHQIDPSEGYESWKDYEEAKAVQDDLDTFIEDVEEIEQQVKGGEYDEQRRI